MLINKDYHVIMKAGKRLLQGSLPLNDEPQRTTPLKTAGFIGFLVAIVLLFGWLITGCDSPAMAYTVEQYAQAIYKAEGGIHTNHPYGILAKYRHTTARQACKNTVWHSWTRFRAINRNLPLKTLSANDFVAYLGKTYCPIGDLNDPNGLNVNWVHNVQYWLNRG